MALGGAQRERHALRAALGRLGAVHLGDLRAERVEGVLGQRPAAGAREKDSDRDALKRVRGVPREAAVRALAEGIAACSHCRPDADLGVLD
ncbi:DUF6233 domain-containing protein [Streptomyces jeddahensis]|uniref:DUF6233 domain-containing protein n=1 Tax=Streptomyces jeddahensis TaxID=1716141 RepID=UPI0022B804CA|nr:DUF6233 domain-containing protein [Streptomyces jeddahensis]